MSFKAIGKLLGGVAPSLAGALGGPLASAAATQIAKVLGCDPTPAAIEDAMQSATPEQIAEIKKAELEFQVRMKELDVNVFELETKDVQHAREIHKDNWTPKALSLLVVGFLCVYVLTITLQTGDQNEALINLVLGWIGGLSSAVISFWFGSSHDHGK